MAKDNVKRESQKKRRKRIALDFDGVLHKYSKKWHDGTIYDDPVDGSVEALQHIALYFDLVIFTCRDIAGTTEIAEWVKRHYNLDIPVTNDKPHADMYIDDRGYHFTGSWEDVLYEIGQREGHNWQPWNHSLEVCDPWS